MSTRVFASYVVRIRDRTTLRRSSTCARSRSTRAYAGSDSSRTSASSAVSARFFAT
jgi:hypothetical protein